MSDGFMRRSTLRDERIHPLRLLGTGAADPTKQIGPGMTVTRTGAGTYRIQWGTTPGAEAPGVFVSWSVGLGSATMVDLAGFTVVRGVYDATLRRLAFTVLDGANAAADLASNQYIDIDIRFATGL